MTRDNSTYKETYNRGLTMIAELDLGAKLPSEFELSVKWGISRTTVRAVLGELNDRDLIDWSGRQKTVLRHPKKSDYFATEETISISERVETQFMEHLLGGDLAPGAVLRESELVRAFGVSTSVVREFLIRFSRFGLIEKEPNRHWVLRGFTKEFAIELFDVREMFETRAFEHILAQGPSGETWQKLVAMAGAHQNIIDQIDGTYLTFPRLDEEFHSTLTGELHNRFVKDFFELVSVIFHYHYRWNKRDEKDRNLVAALTHLRIIHALENADIDQARAALKAHLIDARATLLRSVVWE